MRLPPPPAMFYLKSSYSEIWCFPIQYDYSCSVMALQWYNSGMSPGIFECFHYKFYSNMPFMKLFQWKTVKSNPV